MSSIQANKFNSLKAWNGAFPHLARLLSSLVFLVYRARMRKKTTDLVRLEGSFQPCNAALRGISLLDFLDDKVVQIVEMTEVQSQVMRNSRFKSAIVRQSQRNLLTNRSHPSIRSKTGRMISRLTRSKIPHRTRFLCQDHQGQARYSLPRKYGLINSQSRSLTHSDNMLDGIQS